MSGNCVCYCCNTGLNCITRNVGQFSVSAQASCMSNSCTARYAACSKIGTLNGTVTAQYTSNKSWVNSDTTTIIILAVIIPLFFICICIGVYYQRKKRQMLNSNPIYPSTGPAIYPQSTYPPGYNQGGYQSGYNQYPPNNQYGRSNNNNAMMYGAGGLAAGLVGGAVLNQAINHNHSNYGGGFGNNGAIVDSNSGFGGTFQTTGASGNVFTSTSDGGQVFSTDTSNF